LCKPRDSLQQGFKSAPDTTLNEEQQAPPLNSSVDPDTTDEDLEIQFAWLDQVFQEKANELLWVASERQAMREELNRRQGFGVQQQEQKERQKQQAKQKSFLHVYSETGTPSSSKPAPLTPRDNSEPPPRRLRCHKRRRGYS